MIGVGASLNRHTTEHGYLYPNAKYVHFDPKPHIVMGMGRAADVYVQSDAKAGLEMLDEMLAKRGVKSSGYRTGETLERLSNMYEDRAAFTIEPGTIDPRHVCRAVDDIVPGDIGLFTGNGASSAITVMTTHKPRPYVHASGFFGCIGQMLPTAMGATIANGNKPAVLVDGDASTLMHFSDFDTVVRCKMPLLIVVLNDEALGLGVSEAEGAQHGSGDFGHSVAGHRRGRARLRSARVSCAQDRGSGSRLARMGSKARSHGDRRADFAQRHQSAAPARAVRQGRVAQVTAHVTARPRSAVALQRARNPCLIERRQIPRRRLCCIPM